MSSYKVFLRHISIVYGSARVCFPEMKIKVSVFNEYSLLKSSIVIMLFRTKFESFSQKVLHLCSVVVTCMPLRVKWPLNFDQTWRCGIMMQDVLTWRGMHPVANMQVSKCIPARGPKRLYSNR